MLTIVNCVIHSLVKIDQSEEKSASFIKFKTCEHEMSRAIYVDFDKH